MWIYHFPCISWQFWCVLHILSLKIYCWSLSVLDRGCLSLSLSLSLFFFFFFFAAISLYVLLTVYFRTYVRAFIRTINSNFVNKFRHHIVFVFLKQQVETLLRHRFWRVQREEVFFALNYGSGALFCASVDTIQDISDGSGLLHETHSEVWIKWTFMLSLSVYLSVHPRISSPKPLNRLWWSLVWEVWLVVGWIFFRSHISPL
jgi:hypothetical protein